MDKDGSTTTDSTQIPITMVGTTTPTLTTEATGGDEMKYCS